MKNMRIEVHMTVKVYAGSDIPNEGQPALGRYPDAVEEATVARTVTIGHHVQVREAAAGQLVSILANSAPVMAERIAHSLRTKGH